MSFFCENLSSISSLTKLDFGGIFNLNIENEISDFGIIELSNHFQQIPSLSELYLYSIF